MIIWRNFCLILVLCFSSELLSENQLSKSKYSKYILPPNTEVTHIVVKYKEEAEVKIRNGILKSAARKSPPKGLQRADIESNLAEIELISRENNFPIHRTFDAFSEEKLKSLRKSGEARSKKKLADLNSYHNLFLPKGSRFSDIEMFLLRLNKLKVVELAYAQPIAVSSGHLGTPDFQPMQSYLELPPHGIDANYAWTILGGRGEGVKIIDIENNWNLTHEDLPTLFYDSGGRGDQSTDHGTAVLGVLAAIDNGIGITGIANSASIGVQFANCVLIGGNPNDHFCDSILAAANEVGVGGVVLIELQYPGPEHIQGTSECIASIPDCDSVPLEFFPANFAAIQTATSNGAIVVETSGNGTADLDWPGYNGLFDRNLRDSGAILVSAGKSNQRSPMDFATYGSRIDVHGWGENIITLGYGNSFNGEHQLEEDNNYTDTFGGSSGAGPIVAGAAASIQGIAFNRGLAPYDSIEMRTLLTTTGTAQTHDLARNIGPLPNLRDAIDAMPLEPPTDLAWLPSVINFILN